MQLKKKLRANQITLHKAQVNASDCTPILEFSPKTEQTPS
jgi:hypothetical protein